MNHRLTAILLSLALALPLHSQGKEEGPFVLTVQWTAQAQFAGYYAALEKGFYADEGLNVVIHHPNTSRDFLDRIRNNDSQAYVIPLVSAVEALDKGMELVNVLQTSMQSSIMIVSRRRVNPLTQKGARIACYRSGFSQFAKCMSRDMDLNYQWVESAGMLNLFIDGAVDASMAMSYNEYYQFIQTGLIPKDETQVIRLSDYGYDIQEDGLYLTRKEYDKDPGRAMKFARASRKGWEWVARNPDEALEIVMKYVRRNYIATNPILQRIMLEKILSLMEDRRSGEREYLLREEDVNKTVNILRSGGFIGKEHSINELLP